jgi:sigma-B regulation protein RsbU (phosphoserine phosphatase)
MLALEDGFLRTSYRGEDVFCLYRSFDEVNAGFLVFLVPAAAAVEPAMAAADYALKSTDRQIDALIPIILGLVTAVAVIAFVSARAVTGPVSRLSQAVDRVAGGDFSVRTDIRTGDEFERLGDAFNAMVPQLEKHAQIREAMALAREVQQHLLPHGAPAIDGLDIAGFSLYCDQTGGDYYDFIDLHERGATNIGIAVGDVSGHGLPSALLMTTVRALLHGSANRLVSPPEILQHINHHLVDDLLGGRFMTLFYLLVDVQNRTFNWASAGHDPAIRYDPVKDVFSELSGRDIPLGIDPDWRYEAIERDDYSEEEIVVLGTDGIWDSRSPDGHRFGKERLREIIRAHAAHPAERVCRQIVDELAAFRGNQTQRDDVTGVVLRITEAAG